MTSNISLKTMMLALTAAWAGIPVTHAASVEVDKYPAKPIRLIAPLVPGGGTDITARAIAAKLTERWGQQVIVDNRAGAAGAIGVELITYAKANPGKLSFGSSGTGGLQHFAGEMFNFLAGVKMVHIPYKGGAAATADALAGNTQVGYGTLLSSRAHFKSGRLRPLGITARQRSSTAPEYPTLAEAGLPGYEVDQWYGIITSAKVPRPLVDKLAVAIAEAVKSPETAQRLSTEGSMPVGSTPDQFSAHIRSEIAKWRKLVKDAALVLH